MSLASIDNQQPYGFIAYWRIENFPSKFSDDLSLSSPDFVIKSLKSKWRIEINAGEDGLCAHLFKVSNPISYFVSFSISLLKGSSWITVLSHDKRKFKPGGTGYGREIASTEELIYEKWDNLPNGALTISFRIWTNRMQNESSQCLIVSRRTGWNNLEHRSIKTFFDLKPSDLLYFPSSYDFKPTKAPCVEVAKVKEIKSQHTQTDTNCISFHDKDELLKLFKEKDFTFVTLRTPNKEFSVHKSVLCAKSPVFDAMFERKMRENNSNLVDIEDVDSETVALFIKFLHFEPLDDIDWSTVVKLYYAADKYQIDTLKKECVLILKKELSVENVCDAFILADMHQDKELMNCAQEFFCKNSKVVFKSNRWKDLLCHIELIAEILNKLADSSGRF